MEIYLEHGLSSEANVQTLKVPLLTDKTETEKVHENDVVNEDMGCEQLNNAGVDKVNDVVNEDMSCEQLNDVGVDKVNEVVNEDVGCEKLNDAGVDKVNEVVNDMQAEHGSDVPNIVEVEAEAESDASEQSIRDVHFDDSEEERALGADDGFNYGDVGQSEEELNEKL
ncbi:putative radical SAM protein [Sesbania bispinosa]|nr:putative radical SAM protein [Sesbania bispinosa]